MQPVEYSLRGTKKRPSYSLQRCSAQGQAVIKSAPQVPKYGVKHRHTCTNVHVRRALSLWNSIGGCPHDYTRQQLQVSCVRFASALTCATVARMLEKAPCQIRARIYITLHLLSYYKPYTRLICAPSLRRSTCTKLSRSIGSIHDTGASTLPKEFRMQPFSFTDKIYAVTALLFVIIQVGAIAHPSHTHTRPRTGCCCTPPMPVQGECLSSISPVNVALAATTTHPASSCCACGRISVSIRGSGLGARCLA